MSLLPRMTLIGLSEYDNTIFQNLSFPEGINNETFIDTLLMKYGECPLISPNPQYMKLAIGAWCSKWYANIEKIYTAITSQYNPIYNYDRFETWTGTNSNRETENIDRHVDTVYSKDIDRQEEIDDTTENKVSAYNESTYQPSDETIKDYSNDITHDEDYDEDVDDDFNRTKSGSGNDSKNGHVYGNVGVTKSQEMVIDEIELRTKYNIYNIIAELFYQEFCVYVF